MNICTLGGLTEFPFQISVEIVCCSRNFSACLNLQLRKIYHVRPILCQFVLLSTKNEELLGTAQQRRFIT